MFLLWVNFLSAHPSVLWSPLIILSLKFQTRPTIYQVMKEMATCMGFKVSWIFNYDLLFVRTVPNSFTFQLKMVRITHRVCEAYYARAFLSKVWKTKPCDFKEVHWSVVSTCQIDSNGEEFITSFDMKPSDAINLAARAKVRLPLRSPPVSPFPLWLIIFLLLSGAHTGEPGTSRRRWSYSPDHISPP